MKQFVIKVLSLLDVVESFIRRYMAILICMLVILAIGIADSFYRINSDINRNLQSIDGSLGNIDRTLEYNIDRSIDGVRDAIESNSRY